LSELTQTPMFTSESGTRRCNISKNLLKPAVKNWTEHMQRIRVVSDTKTLAHAWCQTWRHLKKSICMQISTVHEHTLTTFPTKQSKMHTSRRLKKTIPKVKGERSGSAGKLSLASSCGCPIPSARDRLSVARSRRNSKRTQGRNEKEHETANLSATPAKKPCNRSHPWQSYYPWNQTRTREGEFRRFRHTE